MLAGTDQPADAEHGGHDHHEQAVADAPPLCSPELYERLVPLMVEETAPRMFAVVQDVGDRVDWRIAAWGLAFDGYARLVGANRSRFWMSADSPEDALIAFIDPPKITARVVWVHAEPPADTDVLDSA